jgi:regulator of protease activity HflC (stomatin/prohibitin superfamily)
MADETKKTNDGAAAQPDPKETKPSWLARRRAGLNQWWLRNRHRFGLLFLIFLFFVSLFFKQIFISIYPGEGAVLWRRFWGGTVLTKTYGEGLQIIAPWNNLYVYDTRVQELDDNVSLLSSDGLLIDVRLSTRFYPEKDKLPLLHSRVGPDYAEKVVRPEVITALRRVLGNYTPEEIYYRDEEGLLEEIREIADKHIAVNHIVLQDVLILELRLPETLQKEINQKHAKEQAALAHKFVLELEERERERRRIEAEGIQLFQQISGIPILKWRGIEATEKLAQSENAKFVIIGNDSDSLPVILNVDK